MSRTEPPLWPDEQSEMQGQAQAWAAKTAADTLSVCQDLVDFFDQHPQHWRAEDVLDIEEANYELTQILNRVQKKLG
jgi:hypothetical protein